MCNTAVCTPRVSNVQSRHWRGLIHWLNVQTDMGLTSGRIRRVSVYQIRHHKENRMLLTSMTLFVPVFPVHWGFFFNVCVGLIMFIQKRVLWCVVFNACIYMLFENWFFSKIDCFECVCNYYYSRKMALMSWSKSLYLQVGWTQTFVKDRSIVLKVCIVMFIQERVLWCVVWHACIYITLFDLRSGSSNCEFIYPRVLLCSVFSELLIWLMSRGCGDLITTLARYDHSRLDTMLWWPKSRPMYLFKIKVWLIYYECCCM